MSVVGLIALILGAVVLIALVFALRVRPARRERARLMQGAADLHAIAAEDKHARAIAAERSATTDAEAAQAARMREEAEAEIEQVAREGERARALDPDVDTDPDPNAPRLS